MSEYSGLDELLVIGFDATCLRSKGYGGGREVENRVLSARSIPNPVRHVHLVVYRSPLNKVFFFSSLLPQPICSVLLCLLRVSAAEKRTLGSLGLESQLSSIVVGHGILSSSLHTFPAPFSSSSVRLLVCVRILALS